MITLSCKHYTQINPLNWDLHEINRYKDEKCFIYDGDRIKWTDSFEMLKLFIRVNLAFGRHRAADTKSFVVLIRI